MRHGDGRPGALWAVALALLALFPAFDLRAVVGAHAANLAAPAAETAARHAREVLEWIGAENRPPVIAGASLPLTDAATPRESEGSRLLLREAKAFSPKQRLRVLVIGSATDVAGALLVEPTLAERLDVVAMAFETWPEGRDPWNVKNDVRAWQVLLASEVPLTIGPTATCIRHLTRTRLEARAMLAETGAPGRYLLSLLEKLFDESPEGVQVTGARPDAWPIWDLITVAHLLGLTRTQTYARPRLRDDLLFEHAGQGGQIRWITHVDERARWEEFARCVRAASRR